MAIADGRFLAVGSEALVMPLRGEGTVVIDAGGRRVIPGLIDSHLHLIRGGLNYNMELRWDGVRSLADAMAMLKRQVAITPPPSKPITGCTRTAPVFFAPGNTGSSAYVSAPAASTPAAA